MKLPDGSSVKMNAGSRMVYPSVFGSKNREVKIEGEIFFDIEQDKSKPFIVNVDNLKIKVIGTNFNVKAYEEDNNIKITLRKGKIAIGMDKDSDFLELVPGEQVLYDKEKNVFTKTKVNVEPVISWLKGDLQFTRTPLRQIANDLERKFNVKITIGSDKLQNMLFTGDFVRNENLEQILNIMIADRAIKYKIDGNNIYLREK